MDKKRAEILIDAVRYGIASPTLQDEIIWYIETRTPKKVIRHNKWSPVTCPTCGEDLSHFKGDGIYIDNDWMDYCPNEACHQALDWSE